MNLKFLFKTLLVALLLTSCGEKTIKESKEEKKSDNFEYVSERFADLQVLRYQIPAWDKLTKKQKEYVFYLHQAGKAGRDIIWDQNYRHNLKIRKALESIYMDFTGDKTTSDWEAFVVYLKRVWFSNGIHHHYSMDKIKPEFSKEYFQFLLKESKTELAEEIVAVLFNDEDAKKVSLDPKKDLILASATNFYSSNLSEDDVAKYYEKVIDKSDEQPVEYGLNSKLIKDAEGNIYEKVWKVGGMYSEALTEIVSWLEKAADVAENKEQADALRILVEYYNTGDLKKWIEYNIAWLNATKGDIDYINGFVEVYNDPIGMRGSYETIVQIKDFDMSEKMAVLAENAQWFEDNSPIMDEHKKPNVVGVSYKVVNVASEGGDATPATPIGVNLPNSNWIRSTHGSKSVSLGNIVQAGNNAGKGALLEEFCSDAEELERVRKYSKLASKLNTSLHEVIGHASGKINQGVGTPKETLKNYASTLEEARADLVALYYVMDKKLIELGLIESLEVGKAGYDNYIRNGLMTQLIRIEAGQDIEEAHMRNRQLVAGWAFEKGEADSVIVWEEKDGKKYLNIKDYDKLRELFGELLKEIQRVKSEGDYEAGKALVENYGVKVDKALHEEVLERVNKLDIPPYNGYINPLLEPEIENGKIKDVKVSYTQTFAEQMLYYSENFSFLPLEN